MNAKSLLRITLAVAVAGLLPGGAAAQSAADPSTAAQSRLRAQVEAELTRHLAREDVLRDNSSSNPDGSGFVEAATAVRGWSFAINGSSTFDTFRFPVTLSSSLAQLADLGSRPALSNSRWRNSQVSVTYTPLEVGTEEVDRPGGSDSKLSTQNGTKAVASYKISLTRIRDVSDLDALVSEEIGAAFKQATDEAQKRGETLLSDPDRTLREIERIVQPRIDDMVTRFKRELDRSWKWSAKVDYTWITEGSAPDQFAAALLGGREGLGSAKHPVGFGTSLAWNRSRDNYVAQAFDVYGVSAAVGIGLREGLELRGEAQYNSYSGDGFTGISGVLDPTADSEVNLAQSLVFKIAGGQKLSLTLKQLHLTTGDTDFALVTGFGYSF